MNEVFCKAMAGTGAVIDIYCGFNPAYVRVVNISSATIEEVEWLRGMTNGHGIKTVTGTVARTKITANGITPLDDENGLGFRIGADTDVNVDGENIVILAFRGGEGNQF